MSKAKPRVAKKKVANGYKLAGQLPEGEIIQAVNRKKWIIGPPIGQGGFGVIYSARDFDDKKKHWPYVVKIEPHENGPLFVEMHFYTKTYKSDAIEKFLKDKKLKTFGMPQFHGSGSHLANDDKYRFIVIDKLGSDVWKLFLANGRILPGDTVFKMAIQILDVLEFVHESGYIHGDIKGANVLLSSDNSQVYLVDYGLASKYFAGKEFKPNKKKAHNGTIEYLSRDAHDGVETRRGDLEILAFNMIHWLGCSLPWEKDLSNPETVQKSKIQHMKDATTIVKKCFGSKPCPKALIEYLEYLDTLEFNTVPNYKKIRDIFMSGVSEMDGSIKEPMRFETKSNGVNVKRRSSIKLTVPVKKRNSLVAPSLKKRTRTKKVKAVEESEEETVIDSKVTVSKRVKTVPESNGVENGYEGYTASMIEVAKKAAEKKTVKKTKPAKTETKKPPTTRRAAAIPVEDLDNPQPSTSGVQKRGTKKPVEKTNGTDEPKVKRVRKTKTKN